MIIYIKYIFASDKIKKIFYFLLDNKNKGGKAQKI